MTTTGSTPGAPVSPSPSGEALAGLLARSGRAWGISARDVPALSGAAGAEAAGAAMRDVVALGGRVLLLRLVGQASPALDRGELREVGAEAARLGVELHASLGAVHPARYDAGDAAVAIDAGTALGIAAYHVSFGVMDDRFATSPSWTEQLQAAVRPLRGLVDRAGRTVVMRTHEEMTTFELARLCDAVGRETLLVGYSPVNVVTRLEDPIDALGRIASRVGTLFLDDCRIARVAGGAGRRLCPLGEGTVPWSRILAGADPAPPAILDIHQAEFDMPFYDAAWLEHHPDLTVPELISMLRPSLDHDPGQTPFEERRGHGRRLLRRAAELR